MSMLHQSGPKANIAAQENLLLEYIQKLDRHRQGRSAVHIHISKLKTHNRREQHTRMATNTFESLVKLLQGQFFSLTNSDLVFIFLKESIDEVRSAIVKLRFMFADDPLVDETAKDGQSNGFETWYDIETEFDGFQENAQALLEEAKERLRKAADQKRIFDGKPRRPKGEPLSPQKLRRMEDVLSQADLSNLVRRQSICAIVGKSPPQPIFSELFVSIMDLRDTIAPNVNITADRWLFQHLTDTLDRRVLSMLSKHDDRTLDSDISVNLNVPTLLTPEFLKFDDNVKAGMRGSIVLELQMVDIFADLSVFQFAREVVHELGYRICVDGLSIDTLRYVQRERLGADMVKIYWDQSIAERMEDPTRAKELQKRLKNNGLSRVVLCRCDDETAIETGQKLGISMFQGRHVEDLLAADGRKRRVGTVLIK